MQQINGMAYNALKLQIHFSQQCWIVTFRSHRLIYRVFNGQITDKSVYL